MSETVHYKGKLTPLKLPEYITEYLMQIFYLQDKGYTFDDLDVDTKWYDMYESDCIKIKDTWYEIDKRYVDLNEEIIKAEKIGGEIHFDLRWCSGGASFGEVIQEACVKLDDK